MDKKRNDMMRTDKMRMAKPKPKPPMMAPGYAKGTKCKNCGKSKSSCKC